MGLPTSTVVGIRSPNVIALMLRDERIASLSARDGSSVPETLAERITHISHKLTFTDLKSALLSGEPYK